MSTNASHHVPRSLKWSGLIAVLLAIVVVVMGITSRARNQNDLKAWTDKHAVPTVSLIDPQSGSGSDGLMLPGRFEAYARAPIYARVNGYLKNWKVDIGTRVKAGQLLGEIETPDLDQELLQTKGDLASAEANLDLAEITAKRLQEMYKTLSVSKQQLDDKMGDYASKQAIFKAAEANVNRLIALKQFARIVAPFEGVVTARNTDIGALINAGSSATPPLFEVSDTHRLRLYINVPQNYVSEVQAGRKATFTVPEYQNNHYEATVMTTSGAISASTGTTLVQLLVDNKAGQFLPGGYAHVNLALPTQTDILSIPASALIFDNQGLKVATVDQQQKVVVKKVSIARDLGKVVQISEGLVASDRVIENPPDGVTDGVTVNIAQAK